MHLLRPYPDELLGSFLHRATRQLGLSSKALMPALSGTSNKSLPMLITRHDGFAQAFGMELEDFVQKHTLLPYAIAFMHPQAQRHTLASLLTGSDTSVSTAAQNAIKGSRWLRFCPACMAEDLRQYGDTYWHRMHQLPAVSMCVAHQCGLLTSDVNVRATTTMLPPVEARGQAVPFNLPSTAINFAIAQRSRAALEGELAIQDWSRHYRKRAAQLHYTRNGGNVFGGVVSRDLLTFYGESYLRTFGLDYTPGTGKAWPALMFRASFSNSTALKHILMNVFLDSSPLPSKSPREAGGKYGRPRRDWSQLETHILNRLEEAIARHRRQNTRITLKELYEIAGATKILHHNRSKMPRLADWIEEFKASSNSERQTGRRPRVYKKPV